jgi:hypothetical protein
MQVRVKENLADFRHHTLAYIDTDQPRAQRRAMLRERYHFDCLCAGPMIVFLQRCLLFYTEWST